MFIWSLDCIHFVEVLETHECDECLIFTKMKGEECKASIGKHLMRNIAQSIIKVPATTPQGRGSASHSSILHSTHHEWFSESQDFVNSINSVKGY